MASTREIRRRIKSIKSTAQITRAMQLVSAAKMRKAQEAALAGKGYARIMAQTLASIAQAIDPTTNPLLKSQTDGAEAVLFFSTDRGLAGALNTNLFKEAEKGPVNATYITMGKKGRDYVVKTQKTLVADFPIIERPDFSAAAKMAKIVMDDFLSGKVGAVHILYTDFVNTLRQQPHLVQLLPITPAMFASITEGLESKKERAEDSLVAGKEYVFEPSASELLDYILRHFVEMKIYQAMLEAQASEHSARMIAMKNATDNAKDLVNDLTLTYNQVRQSAITTELLEITTAAAAIS